MSNRSATVIEQPGWQPAVASTGSRAEEVPAIRVEPSKGWAALQLREAWKSRELLYFLVWRDVTVRYKQTVFGVLWAVFQPLFGTVVFTLFFGRLAKMPSDGVPYPLFAYAALVPWTFFANGLNQISNSLVRDANLITKVYVPRLLIPFAAAVAGLVDFLVAFVILLGMMVLYRTPPTANIIFLPFLALLALATSISVGLWLSALNVQFRDVRYVLPFVVQAWLFATPIVYPSSLLPARWRLVYGLNPMVGVVEGFRWALLGTHTRPGGMIIVSALTVVGLLIGGMIYFRRTESKFADVV
ncbi:MAG TPA: ABC transporter permease [bacterium]|nr:ABC transporter permease [bacterium]